jgi:magnesium chelatase family protein
LAGELSLAGELRPVRGALALAWRCGVTARAAAGAAHRKRPPPRRRCRAWTCAGTVHLADVVARCCRAMRRSPCHWAAPAARAGTRRRPDLRDVKGQAAAKRALEMAAAGGHSLLAGRPAGHRQVHAGAAPAGLLPPMDEDEALASAALAGLAPGASTPRAGPAAGPRAAPFRQRVALVGGGSPPRPGEISLAHGGVLFLDELPEFPSAALEALREPLETGRITISRAARRPASSRRASSSWRR